MSLLPIVIAPDRRLKTPCKPVEQIDDSVRTLLQNMLETMYEAPGIGLAAPQVGSDRRVIVVDVAREGEDPRPHKMVNPTVTWASEEVILMNEGCLSLPEIFVDVERPDRIRVAYQDENAEAHEIEADGLFARCIQHEIDHLDGVLHVDYLSRIKRELTLRKLAKVKPELLREQAEKLGRQKAS
ncbi:MAG: peptide deformylase [Alphaproteobacteria bacterium]|nr:peptide deformylase [Alphaproteobacteria bacterium]MCB9929294.1 peptide deformylase [Alphaproteobacteria bacterium]